MKVEQTEELPEKLRGADAGGRSSAGEGGGEGVAEPVEAGDATGPKGGEGSMPPHAGSRHDAGRGRSRILRLVYWVLWFVLTPIVLACLLVWALTPPSGV